MAAASGAVSRKVEALGLSMLQPAAGLATLERLLCAEPAALPAVAPAVPFNWGVLLSKGAGASPGGAGEMFAALRAHRAARARPRPRTTAPVASAAPEVAAAAASAAAARRAENAMQDVQGAITSVLGRQVGPRSELWDATSCKCSLCACVSVHFLALLFAYWGVARPSVAGRP